LSDKKVTTQYEISPLGLPLKQTKQYGSMDALTTQYEYDSKGNVTKKTDPLGLSESYTYNADATVASSINTLGLTTNYGYNNWGQQVKTTDQFGVEEENSSQWTTDNDALYKTISTKTNEPSATVYYDALGREIRSETQNISGTLYLDKEYNSKGLLQQESKPYFSGATPIWTNYTYDEYGRKIGVNINGQETSYAYSGNTTTVTNPAGQTSQQTGNAKGDVMETVDALGNKVSYTYNSIGKPIKIEAAGGTTEMAYDAAGRQLTLKDADAGTTTYEYNAAGQITKQTDARGKISSIRYDAYGRVTTKTNDDGTTTYTYNSKGQLESESNSNNTKTYTYDTYGRKTKEVNRIGGTDYPFTYAYDINSNVTQKTYPSGYILKYGYTSGELTSIKNGNDKSIWQLAGENAVGQITGYNWGNGIVSANTYNDDGFLTAQTTGNIQEMRYRFNPASGNLLERKDSIKSQIESFAYDSLNRLTDITNGSNLANMAYANNGNITSKTDVGTYAYGDGNHPHAITAITGNPNTISSLTQKITYNSQGKVSTINEGARSLNITYGVDGQRIEGKWYDVWSHLTKTRVYLGDYEIHIDSAKNTKEIHYIAAPTGLAAVEIKQNGKDSLFYTCTDHLGSLMVLTDSLGNELERYSYDAWGRQRNPDDWATYTGKGGRLDRAYEYTGHETLADFGLINMNGRVYDPILARMLSADNYVQSPLYSQNYNRYSYCVNNPLIYTDLTGQIFGIDDLLMAAVIGAIIGQTQQALTGDISSKAMFTATGIGALSGVASSGVGSIFGSVGSMGVVGELARAGAHGVTQGAISELAGGNFWSGFAAGSLGSLAGSAFQTVGGNFANSTIGTVGFSALSGGVGAKLSGGNFWQGAAIGGTVGLLNHVRHGISVKDAKLLAKLYLHYQVGNNEPITIDASELDVDGLTQEDLKIDLGKYKVGDKISVNFFDGGANGNALAFGRVNLVYLGNNKFTFSDQFDFNYDKNGTFKRNALTLVGGAVFGRFYNIPIPTSITVQPNYFFGGSFPLQIKGSYFLYNTNVQKIERQVLFIKRERQMLQC